MSVAEGGPPTSVAEGDATGGTPAGGRGTGMELSSLATGGCDEPRILATMT